MKIVVSANGADMDAPASSVFGRCPVYIFVDTETGAYEAVENPAANAAGGAGIQAAQFVIDRGAKAVVTGRVGPKALDVLQAAGVLLHLVTEGSVRAAVDQFKADKGQVASEATNPAHAGTGEQVVAADADAAAARQQELADLTEIACDLRKQLADVMERIGRLEEV